MTATMDRRQAMVVIASFAASLATSGLAVAACPLWLAADTDLDGLQELGREYLAQHSTDADVDRLWSRIAIDRATTSPATIAIEIQRDYASGQLVRVSGWYLSLTEARIFAALSTRC
jgi:hypothetical protein